MELQIRCSILKNSKLRRQCQNNRQLSNPKSREKRQTTKDILAIALLSEKNHPLENQNMVEYL